MLVACLVVVAPASWAARAGSAAEAGAEVPFVVLVPGRNSQIHHPGVIRINSDAGCNTLSEALTETEV
jgi:hypothetical protein